MPIVPAAILFDLGRGGSWLHHPGAGRRRRGLPGRRRRAGGPGPGRRRHRGADRAACAAGWARHPRCSASGATVGALVVVNAVGAAFGADGRLLAAHLAPGDDLPAPDAARVAAYWAAVAEETERLRAGTATTLAVVATDVTLTKAGCQKLAGVAHDGFARALSPVHTAYDGDTVFALATGARPAVTGIDEVELQTAAADCVSLAIVRAVLAATSVDRTADGGVALPSYRDALVGDGLGSAGVVRRLDGHLDVVRVALLAAPAGGDPDEPALRLELGDRCARRRRTSTGAGRRRAGGRPRRAGRGRRPGPRCPRARSCRRW